MPLSKNKLLVSLLLVVLTGGLFLFKIVEVKAVGDAYFPQNTTVSFDVGNFTIAGGSDADEVTTTNGQITIKISPGQTFIFKSSDRKLLTNNGGYSYTCSSAETSISITVPTGGAQKTVTITPDSLNCDTSTGGGGGGGGGGDGALSSSTSSATSTVTPATNAQTIASQIAALQARIAGLSGQTVSSSQFTRNLNIGFSGEDVRSLQRYLNAAGFKIVNSGPGSPGNETSLFGSLTRAALAKWQVANGVSPASGYFGPLTRAKITSVSVPVVSPAVSPVATPVQTPQVPGAAYNFTRNLTIGSQGADVRALQDYLTTTGHFTYSGGSSGYFGLVTQAAVAAWQKANNISPAVGYFGPKSNSKYKELMGL